MLQSLLDTLRCDLEQLSGRMDGVSRELERLRGELELLKALQPWPPNKVEDELQKEAK